MMNVLFVLQFGKYGGATKMLYWVASELHKAGHHTTVVAVEACSDIEMYRNGWTFVSLNKKKEENFLFRNTTAVVRDFAALWRFTAKENPDIIISFGDHSFYPALMCAKLQKKRLLISERVDPYSSQSKSEKIRRALYRFADAGVFQTEKAKEFYPEHLQNRSVVINNPVRCFTEGIPWQEGLANNSIVYLGRIDMVQKRLDVLLEAFQQVLHHFPDYKLMIYGDGKREDVNKVKAIINNLGISGSVELCGITKSPEEVLRASKLFVTTSDFEGISNSVIEALNAGIPVVATDCNPGGARLLLGESEYGELVECGNSAAVAAGIVRSLSNMDAARTKAAKGKNALKRFAPEKIAKEWVTFVERVVKAQ